jgi:hypothetical protein
VWGPRADITLLFVRLGQPESDLAFYTVANAPYFLGTVALLNSLRRVGETAPFYVVDCGLTAEQRRRLATRATIVEPRSDFHPQLQKATGLLEHPASVMVFIDSDIIVTRPLGPLVDEANAQKLVVFQDYGNPGRFFAEWGSPELGEPRPAPYVNSGFFALSWETGEEFLPLFSDLQRTVDLSDTYLRGGSPDHPLYFVDQDIFNALACTRYDGRVARVEGRLAPFPPFAGVELQVGEQTLCRYPDGVIPFALHHTHRKPWLAALKPNVYSRLFTFVVTDRAACLPLSPRELPLRLTNAPLARFDRVRASVQHVAHRHLRGKLGIRPKLAQLRARLAG